MVSRPATKVQTLDGKRILTKYDIQWVLDQSDGGPIKIPYTLLREGNPIDGSFSLEPGWKVGDPKEYSWRVENPFTAHMIKFLPAPGFVGERLGVEELRTLNLPDDQFALRVEKLNYGPYQAGIRVGDVILGAAGVTEFDSTRDFYAWCEQLRREGRDIKIQLRREGHELAMMVSLNYLNYSRMERAPRVQAGFIAQQLTGNAGVRVGHVTEGSSAKNSGIRHGDRIVRFDGEPVETREKLMTLFNQKTPGDLVMLDLVRNGKLLQLSYSLSAENQEGSEVARLEENVTHAGQHLDCIVSIPLLPGRHIYSVHKKSIGLPTEVKFRGLGFRLAGGLIEPLPIKTNQGDWILEGDVELRQPIEITDPETFQMLLEVTAQVCDDRSCHLFHSVLQSREGIGFSEYDGDFKSLRPVVEQ